MNENLFSYGTLQKDAIQMELFGRLLTGAKDVLQRCKLASIKITDEAFPAKGAAKFQQTLIRSNDNADAIEGTVFEISREELLRADKYEPENYTRVRVTLRSGKAAWNYLVTQIQCEFMKIITFLILSFLTIPAFAQEAAKTQTEKPFVLGVIREIQSAELAEKRILNIYLPEGYEKNSSAKYPVIYLLDGSAVYPVKTEKN